MWWGTTGRCYVCVCVETLLRASELPNRGSHGGVSHAGGCGAQSRHRWCAGCRSCRRAARRRPRGWRATTARGKMTLGVRAQGAAGAGGAAEAAAACGEAAAAGVGVVVRKKESFALLHPILSPQRGVRRRPPLAPCGARRVPHRATGEAESTYCTRTNQQTNPPPPNTSPTLPCLCCLCNKLARHWFHPNFLTHRQDGAPHLGPPALRWPQRR